MSPSIIRSLPTPCSLLEVQVITTVPYHPYVCPLFVPTVQVAVLFPSQPGYNKCAICVVTGHSLY